jgi:hypothetical protein
VEADQAEYYTYNNSQIIYFVDYSDASATEIDDSEETDTDTDDDDDDDIKYFKNGTESINLTSNTQVDRTIFEALKVTPNAILKLVGKAYTYTFTSEGTYNESEERTIDFGVEITQPSDGVVTLDVNYSGTLPMSGELTLELGEDYKEKTLYLSYVDSETGEKKLYQVVNCSEEGFVTFSIENNANYTLSTAIQLDGSIFTEDVSSKSLLNGYPDGTFKPDQSMTRAEITYFLNNLIKTKESDDTITFTDVDPWVAAAVSNMIQYGFISGYSENSFEPDMGVTRLDFAEILYKMLALESLEITTTISYEDVDESIDREAIDAVTEIGLLQGYDNKFMPFDDITRAEVVTIINRLLSRDTDNVSTDLYFTDVSSDHWAYKQIMSGVE